MSLTEKQKEVKFLMMLRDLTSVIDQDASAVTNNDNVAQRVGGTRKKPQAEDRDSTMQADLDKAKEKYTGALPDMAPETTFLY